MNTTPTDPQKIVAFQGEAGANSHLSCQAVYPDFEAMACATFEDTFLAVEEGRAEVAMIPIENSVAGRVADIHHLMPESGLYIIGEHFQPVNHQLLIVPGAKLDGIKMVHSHVQALGQCRETLRGLGLATQVEADTAGAARAVAENGDPGHAAIASTLAAQIYGLEILRADIEDASHNTTRFVILSRHLRQPEPGDGPIKTTFVFNVRNVPAALYKAMGGFATNGVNMIKLESYQIGGSFSATQFYADIIGHPEEKSVRLALEELEFFTSRVKILGVYPAAPDATDL
jgi:prephenate dehydratase